MSSAFACRDRAREGLVGACIAACAVAGAVPAVGVAAYGTSLGVFGYSMLVQINQAHIAGVYLSHRDD